MVRAILEGRKTQTRRVLKPQPDLVTDGFAVRFTPDDQRHGRLGVSMQCPYGQVGDRLWVRETWHPDPDADSEAWFDHTDSYVSWAGCGSRIDGVPVALRSPESCIYREGWNGSALKWRPGIHMPRWASRITLEVTGVRVEGLQDITHEQAIAEGVHAIDVGSGYQPRYSAINASWADVVEQQADAYEDATMAFRDLWQSINGAGSWDANPWVWVVEFKRLEAEAKAA